MKFALRRVQEPPALPEPDPLEVPPPPRPTPPPGAPVSAYAGIGDGRTLWLAVEAVAGTLAFRPAEGGEVIAAHSDLAEDQPAYRSVRVDLTGPAGLGGRGAATYDVVVVPPGGGEPRPVWSPPLPQGGPTRPPPAPDGRTRFTLARTGPGFLQVRRVAVPPAAELLQVALRDGGIELVIDPAAAGEPSDIGELLLVGAQDALLARLPLTRGERGWEASLTLDAVPASADTALRVVVGTPDAWVPVRRRHNGLTKTSGAVLLPTLTDDETGQPLLRLRWGPGGGLQVRLPRPDGADDTDDGEGPDPDDESTEDRSEDDA